MTRSILRVLLVFVFAVITLPSFAASDGIHLSVSDVVMFRQTGSKWQADYSRKVGLGMDISAGKTFSASLVDILPKGCKLISPKPGIINISTLRGKKCPVKVESKSIGQTTRLWIGFTDLPGLPKGQECCSCDGSCGRACSIEMIYKTRQMSMPPSSGYIICSASPSTIRVGKVNRVKVTIEARNISLTEAAVAVSIPQTVNSASITVKNHASILQSIVSSGSITRFASRRGIKKELFTLELDVKPTKAGKTTISSLAELVGKSARPLRAAPSLSFGPLASTGHQTFVRVAGNLVLNSK